MNRNYVINERERRAITGISRSTWHRWEKAGLVPRRIQLGPRRVAWYLADINDWLEERARDTAPLTT